MLWKWKGGKREVATIWSYLHYFTLSAGLDVSFWTFDK